MKTKMLRQKKILGAVQMLPAKQHSQPSPTYVKIGWISCAIKQATSKQLTGFFFRLKFNTLILIYFFKYKTIETHVGAFLPLNISAVGSVTTILEESVHATNSPNFGFNVFFALSWYVVRAALNFRTSTQSCITFMLFSLDQLVTKK